MVAGLAAQIGLKNSIAYVQLNGSVQIAALETAPGGKERRRRILGT
jgi:hypothetical protein